MASLFPNPELGELFGFSLLHQAVLGLNNVSLETILQDEKTQIDGQDYSGRTALSWAAASGDCDATQLLATYGATPNLQDKNGFSPLNYASGACAYCCSLLISSKSGILLEEDRSKFAIHSSLEIWVMRGADDTKSQCLEIIKTLVQAGFDLNHPDPGTHNRPLHIAAFLNYAKVVEYLIDQGADPDVYARSGHTPLTVAVWQNHHATIELLLGKGQDHSTHIDEHDTLLHLAAQCADCKTLYLLANARLRRRDTGVKNSEGLSALQLAMQRTDTDVEWQAAFWEFLKSIDINQPI